MRTSERLRHALGVALLALAGAATALPAGVPWTTLPAADRERLTARAARLDLHLPFGETTRDIGGVDILDAGRAMGIVGRYGNLPPHPGAGIDAHRLQDDGQEAGRYLLS